MKQGHLAYLAFLLLPVLCSAESNVFAAAVGETYESRIAKVAQEFLAIQGGMPYRFVVENEGTTLKYDDAVSRVQLDGAALDLAQRYDLDVLAAGLWRYLDDPQHAFGACVCLYGAAEAKLPGRSKRVLNDVAYCKWVIRRVLGKPDEWYPHEVLFDRDKVLRDRTNAVARARNIVAMQSALADPRVRSENPLEVDNILFLLSAIDAREAVTNVCDFLLYDCREGKDYRIKKGDSIERGEYRDRLMGPAYLAQFGGAGLPFVLDRLARATPEELSVGVSGGGLPVLAIRYFYLLHYSEAQAIKAIEDFKKAQKGLTETQVAALDEILVAIRNKKYRPIFMKGSDWSAPLDDSNVGSPR